MNMDIETRLGTEPFHAATSAAQPPSPPEPGPSPAHDRRRRRPGKAVLAAIAASAVIVAGVAGVTLAMRRPPSPEAYAAKADAICLTTNPRAAAIPTASTYPQLTSAAGTLAGTAREQLVSLRRLQRPAGFAGAQAVAFIDTMDAGARAAEALKDTPVPTNDHTTVNNTKILQSAFADAREKAAALGLSACAVGLQPGVDTVVGGSHAVVKAAFVAKADTLCRAAARELDELEPANASLAEVSRYLQGELQVFTELWSDLEGLPVPPGDEIQVQALRSANDEHLRKVRELRDALAGGDFLGMVAIGRELDVAVTTADAKLDAYGLKVCGSNFGAL